MEQSKVIKILKSFFIKHGNWTLIPQKEIDEVIKQIQGNDTQDLSFLLLNAIRESQSILAKWIESDSKILDSECLQQLLGVLDNRILVEYIRSINAKEIVKRVHNITKQYVCERKDGIIKDIYHPDKWVIPNSDGEHFPLSEKKRKLKIFTAIYDARMGEYLEEQIETWRAEKGYDRKIINSSITIHNFNVILLITYSEIRINNKN